MVAVQRLIELFQQELVRGSVTLVPVVSEDAFARGHRTAADDLDLARVCPGDDGGSTTERNAAALSRLIRSADFYVDLHTGGARYKILPLAGYMMHQDRDVLLVQRGMAKAFGLPVAWGTSARLEGRSLSVARDALVPAIYVEYGGGPYSSAAADALVAGCLNVAAHLDLAIVAKTTGRVRYWVEDNRPGSGHLQVQHPAPIAGLFIPSVALGDTVRSGHRIGEIVDPISQSRAPVVASADGIVLFLHASVAVRKGDGLGGLLPITEPGEARYEEE